MQDEVTQADREAAADVAQLHMLYPTPIVDEIRDGKRDYLGIVQVLTRHYQAERETLARMEWKDIESAPKDGTWFLAYEPDGERGAHYACSFYGDDEYRGVLWQSACGQYVTSSPEPTHWMPLPPAPEAGQ